MRFRETQRFDWWVWALLAFIGIIVPAASVFAAGKDRSEVLAFIPLPISIALIVTLLFGQMITEVDASELRVKFGWVSLVKFRFDLASLNEARAETYHPIIEFGGWGIRGFGANRALNMRGNQGVRLTFADGRRLMIGSCKSGELESAMRQVIHLEALRF